MGASPFHLCRLFRAHTGQSIHEYRTQARLRLALETLADRRAGAAISSVAHDLGFASHAHFVRVCREQLGAPPRVVRAALRDTSD